MVYPQINPSCVLYTVYIQCTLLRPGYMACQKMKWLYHTRSFNWFIMSFETQLLILSAEYRYYLYLFRECRVKQSRAMLVAPLKLNVRQKSV